MAAAGTLSPESWKWMLDSRLVFFAKTSGTLPRPVGVGDFWRRLISKHLLHKSQAKVRQVMLEADQFGVPVARPSLTCNR